MKRKEKSAWQIILGLLAIPGFFIGALLPGKFLGSIIFIASVYFIYSLVKEEDYVNN